MPAKSGEKRVYTTTVGPLFSRSVARPRGHRATKSYGVYHFPGKTREKGVHHRSGKKGIHHRASDTEKEKKGGLHGGGDTFFFPVYGVGHTGVGRTSPDFNRIGPARVRRARSETRENKGFRPAFQLDSMESGFDLVRNCLTPFSPDPIYPVLMLLGACAMTTKFLETIKFALLKFYCRGACHEKKKNSVLDDFAVCPQGAPTSKSRNFIFIVVSQSLSYFRVPQKEVGKRSSITFFSFRDTFGHFSVTFSDASVTFFVTFLPDSFCQTPFARLLLPDSFCQTPFARLLLQQGDYCSREAGRIHIGSWAYVGFIDQFAGYM